MLGWDLGAARALGLGLRRRVSGSGGHLEALLGPPGSLTTTTAVLRDVWQVASHLKLWSPLLPDSGQALAGMGTWDVLEIVMGGWDCSSW